MWLVYILIFFMGASIFSFLNVIVYRLPLGLDFVKGRSFCPSCEHELSFLDMVPVLSYVFLGGKCRYCKSRIELRGTLIEILGGLLAVKCFLNRDLISFLFICVLNVVCFIDLDTMIIPDGCHVAILILSIISIILGNVNLVSRLIGLLCVSVPMLLICLVIPGGFGGGDIKLMGAAGFFLGWKLTLISTVIAILLGGFYGMYLMIFKKMDKKDHFAFGPFLCFGLVTAMFYGEILLNWYLSFVLF